MKKIECWEGEVEFGARAAVLNFCANILPEYWTVEIAFVQLMANSKELKDTPSHEELLAVVESSELCKVIELGALKDIRRAVLGGNAIDQAVVSRLCESTSMSNCEMINVLLLDRELDVLKRLFPHCNFETKRIELFSL